MDHSQKIKTNSAVVIVILVIATGYFLLGKDVGPLGTGQKPSIDNQEPMKVVSEKTPTVNGSLPAPSGFPQDIPVEGKVILESVTTSYPDNNAKQLSVSYRSSKTVAQKYTEYKNYMTASDYKITEGATNSPVRAIFGTKTDVNLSVAISNSNGSTLVQISYLLKSL